MSKNKQNDQTLWKCIMLSKTKQNNNLKKDLPSGPVVKNLPSNAGDMGLIPCQGNKIPRVPMQLSLSATTTEPTHKIPHDMTKTRSSQINK